MFGFKDNEDGAQTRFEEENAIAPVVPWVKYRLWWLLHNTIAHTAIGLSPCRATFDFHDYTARKMHGQSRQARR